MLCLVNKARQNHAFASVTYKMRRAHFPVRADWGEVLRQKFCMPSCNLPQNEGKTTAERAGFSPKNVAAKCFVKLISPLFAKIYHKTLSFGG